MNKNFTLVSQVLNKINLKFMHSFILILVHIKKIYVYFLTIIQNKIHNKFNNNNLIPLIDNSQSNIRKIPLISSKGKINSIIQKRNFSSLMEESNSISNYKFSLKNKELEEGIYSLAVINYINYLRSINSNTETILFRTQISLYTIAEESIHLPLVHSHQLTRYDKISLKELIMRVIHNKIWPNIELDDLVKRGKIDFIIFRYIKIYERNELLENSFNPLILIKIINFKDIIKNLEYFYNCIVTLLSKTNTNSLINRPLSNSKINKLTQSGYKTKNIYSLVKTLLKSNTKLKLNSLIQKRSYNTKLDSIWHQDLEIKILTKDLNTNSINNLVKKYFKNLLNIYIEECVFRTEVFIHTNSGGIIKLPETIFHNLSENSEWRLTQLIEDWLILNNLQKRRKVKNLLKIVFKYSWESEIKLMESSFNPLFFIKNMNFKKSLYNILNKYKVNIIFFIITVISLLNWWGINEQVLSGVSNNIIPLFFLKNMNINIKNILSNLWSKIFKRSSSNIKANNKNKDFIYKSKELNLLEILNLITKKRQIFLVSNMDKVVKGYIKYLENKYPSTNITLRTIVSLTNSSENKLEFPIRITHDISEGGLDILTMYIIHNIEEQKARIINSEIIRKNYIVQLEFKYEIYEPKLLESSFNPLFFIKNLNFNKIFNNITSNLQFWKYSKVNKDSTNLQEYKETYILTHWLTADYLEYLVENYFDNLRYEYCENKNISLTTKVYIEKYSSNNQILCLIIRHGLTELCKTNLIDLLLFNLRDELTKNPSIHTEDHVELIEFRYTVNSNNNTDTDLLESSFNPLFFIKNMDINIKNIYTNIKKIYTNIKNLINKNILITNLIKDLKSILIIINNNKILKLLLGILIIYR